MAKRKRTTLTLSVTEDTKERLRLYAEQQHITASQAATLWIWTLPIQASTPDDSIHTEGGGA